MHKNTVILGVIFAILAVVLGAFGAHGLKSILSTEALATFEVGVRYQMYHALALIVVGLSGKLTGKIVYTLTTFFTLGILLFSGSIYLLSLQDIFTVNFSGIGFITPLGGTCFILGWCYFLWKIITLKSI
ncbi:DUF423 domain-containing protein [Planktosalinus lacus]|uniref:Membrane protein n=1 Tax=Planktosalinus lacus TaxID=1526573 RepID=A0A8J2VA25_9FLAO|nr:DUF423 domain-containing protein [Planktosalinus lacus]GGD90213.1 membrane protein [Planktosalinus lacus]